MLLMYKSKIALAYSGNIHAQLRVVGKTPKAILK